MPIVSYDRRAKITQYDINILLAAFPPYEL